MSMRVLKTLFFKIKTIVWNILRPARNISWIVDKMDIMDGLQHLNHSLVLWKSLQKVCIVQNFESFFNDIQQAWTASRLVAKWKCRGRNDGQRCWGLLLGCPNDVLQWMVRRRWYMILGWTTRMLMRAMTSKKERQSWWWWWLCRMSSSWYNAFKYLYFLVNWNQLLWYQDSRMTDAGIFTDMFNLGLNHENVAVIFRRHCFYLCSIMVIEERTADNELIQIYQ